MNNNSNATLHFFKRKQVELHHGIGNGVFGQVFHGTLKAHGLQSLNDKEKTKYKGKLKSRSVGDLEPKLETEIAIKIPNKNIYMRSSNHRNQVLCEIQIVAKLRHRNLVQFIGMVENQSSLPWLLMEFMHNGNLHDYLRKRPKNDCDFGFFIKASHNIASGMSYLHYEQNIVHCDLHLQNCLVGDDECIKIGDFGQSFVIVNEEDVLKGPIGSIGRPNIPIEFIDGGRWKPPEYIPGPNFRPVFTRPGDVFSFSILLFELWSGGTVIPFNGLSDEQVLKALATGKDPFDFTMSPNIQVDILILMMDCWNFSPNSRPTFLQILTVLNDNLLLHEKDSEETAMLSLV